MKCPKESCKEAYNGETGRRISKHFEEHRGEDKNPHVYQHSAHLITHQYQWTISVFKMEVIAETSSGEKIRGSVNRSTLNNQDKSILMKLFN